MRPVDQPPPLRTRDPHNDEVRQRLRDLPCEIQPPSTWAQFQMRSRMRNQPWRESKAPRVTREHALAAAGVAALIAALAMWGRADHSGSMGALPQLAQSTSIPGAWAADTPQPSTASIAVQAAVAAQFAMLTRAQSSQRWLERQPAEPIVVRMGPRLAIANLEDRLAWMDDVLTEAQTEATYRSSKDEQLVELQQERARLVNSLAQVRYAETLVAQVP